MKENNGDRDGDDDTERDTTDPDGVFVYVGIASVPDTVDVIVIVIETVPVQDTEFDEVSDVIADGESTDEID